MPREIALFSLLVPSLLPILVGCALLFVALDLLISRLGWYRFVWHPALFRAALFTVLFCVAGLLLRPLQ
jgi:protein AaeX